MIDIWMSFTMFFPFFGIFLYSLLDFIKNKQTKLKLTMKTLDKLDKFGDKGPVVLAVLFIIGYWVVGLFSYILLHQNGICDE